MGGTHSTAQAHLPGRASWQPPWLRQAVGACRPGASPRRPPRRPPRPLAAQATARRPLSLQPLGQPCPSAPAAVRRHRPAPGCRWAATGARTPPRAAGADTCTSRTTSAPAGACKCGHCTDARVGGAVPRLLGRRGAKSCRAVPRQRASIWPGTARGRARTYSRRPAHGGGPTSSAPGVLRDSPGAGHRAGLHDPVQDGTRLHAVSPQAVLCTGAPLSVPGRLCHPALAAANGSARSQLESSTGFPQQGCPSSAQAHPGWAVRRWTPGSRAGSAAWPGGPSGAPARPHWRCPQPRTGPGSSRAGRSPLHSVQVSQAAEQDRQLQRTAGLSQRSPTQGAAP